MPWTRWLCYTLCLCLWSATVMATSWVQPDNLGVVCLDETTGRPQWEHFPDRLSPCELATDSERLYMVMGPRRRYLMDPMIDATRTRVVEAIDLSTRSKAPDANLPDAKLLTLQAPTCRPLILSTGDHVAVSCSNHRAIVIMKGDSNDVRSIIPVPWVYQELYVHRNLIVLTRFDYAPKNEGSSTYWVVALDAVTQKTVWTMKATDISRTWGTGQGERFLYVLEPQAVRALDLDTGSWAWEKRLPRILGWAWAAEHQGHAYIVCDYLSGPPTYYLYCLDASTGNLLWAYDPDGSLVPLPLLFLGGKVYTQIAPTRLMEQWKASGSVDGDGHVIKTEEQARVELLKERFAEKPDEAVELNLRAWHALGDRSALRLLKTAEDALASGSLKPLLRTLSESFPTGRDPMRLLKFLADEFEHKPELRIEVRRILDEFNPVPYWLDHATIDYPPRPSPQLDLSLERTALIESYKHLKVQADKVPFSGFDRATLFEVMQSRGFATFDWLLQARQLQDFQEYRRYIVAQLFQRFPERASEWALEHEAELSPTEVGSWVHAASADWIEAHIALFDQWLRHEETEIQGMAASRLLLLDEAFALPLCEELLTEYAHTSQQHLISSLSMAIGRLGRSKQEQYVGVIRPYLDSGATGVQNSVGINGAEVHQTVYPLRRAAMEAMRQLGTNVTVNTEGVQEPQGSEEQIKGANDYRAAQKTYVEMLNANLAGNTSEAQRLARQFIKTGRGIDFELAEAYGILQDWNYVSDYWLTNRNTWNDKLLLDALMKAGRMDDIERVVKDTQDKDARIQAAFTLIQAHRTDAPFRALSTQLSDDPADWEACVGLALIHRERRQIVEADALFDRAILLLPVPSAEPAFHQTITYWIDRGRPEKAKAWVKESAMRDFEAWEAAALFEWARQYPQLRKTSDFVFRSHRGKEISQNYGPALGITGGSVATGLIITSLWGLHRSRGQTT